LIKADARFFIATNWHVVTGRHPFTEELGKSAKIPESLFVHFRTENSDELTQVAVPLHDKNNQPLWIAHADRKLPEQSNHANLAIDLVLIDVTQICPPNVTGHLIWRPDYQIRLNPMEPVAIIGYPFGLFGRDAFPIWITGTVANDLAGEPQSKYFFVDANTGTGNSGSLVIHRSSGAAFHKPGGYLHPNGSVSYFMGIYSGRIKAESNIGIVWHWELIQELIQAKVRLAND